MQYKETLAKCSLEMYSQIKVIISKKHFCEFRLAQVILLCKMHYIDVAYF